MEELGLHALGIAILTASDTRSPLTDTSGDLAVSLLREAGHQIIERSILPDDVLTLRAQMEHWIADPRIDVVVSTGGTGLTGRDVCPEAMAPLVSKPIPGFGELFRYLSYQEIGTSSLQSRAQAAVCSGTLFFLLPGSTGAVRTAIVQLIIPQLDNRHRPCNLNQLLPRIRGES